MRLQTLVWFSSCANPFVVTPAYCLNLECSCRDVRLRLTEIEPQGKSLPNPLTFEVRVCLENWTEPEPPERSARVASLVRELLAEYPPTAIQALVDDLKQQRATEQRLGTHRFDLDDRGALICYSDVVQPNGGLQQGGQHGFFLTHGGQDYLIEDHYCPTPDCDCREVHFEFWKRTSIPDARTKAGRRIKVIQFLMATCNFSGEVREVRFTEADATTTREILTAWQRQCAGLRDELQRRYQQVKAIGERSFPPTPTVTSPAVSSRPHEPARNVTPRTGRNDPCPCGSGRKFKRCCARQAT